MLIILKINKNVKIFSLLNEIFSLELRSWNKIRLNNMAQYDKMIRTNPELFFKENNFDTFSFPLEKNKNAKQIEDIRMNSWACGQ